MGIKGKGLKVVMCCAIVIAVVAALGLVVIVRNDFIHSPEIPGSGFRPMGSIGIDYSGLRNQLAKNFVIKKLMDEREKTKILATATELSFHEPASFAVLQNIIARGQTPQPDELTAYKNYYETALKSFPQIQEIKGVLGFLYYYMRDQERAAELYHQASVQDPYFFWNHYNLGVILYEAKRYPESQEEFKKALACPFEANVQFIVRSRIYLQIFWPDQNWGGYSIAKGLEAGFAQARLFLKGVGQPASYGQFLRLF